MLAESSLETALRARGARTNREQLDLLRVLANAPLPADIADALVQLGLETTLTRLEQAVGAEQVAAAATPIEPLPPLGVPFPRAISGRDS